MNKFTSIGLALVLALAGAATAEEGFRIRPHLQNVSQTGATLIWETHEAGLGSIQYGAAEGDLDERVGESEATTIHRLRMDDLKAETAYSYRVEVDGQVQEATFTTAPAGDDEIVFVIVGDPRRWSDRWAETGMDEHVKQWDADLFLTMGDLVVDGHQYEQWPEHFARFQDLTASKWFVTARGNHEGSQLRDTENDWFAKYHELPGGEPYAAFDWGNTHFMLISYESTGREKDWTTSGEWLDAHLDGVDKKYTVVAHHFPVYCTGYDSTDLSRKEPGERAVNFRKVLDKHDVTLDATGHTHIYERHYPLRNDQRDDRNGTYYVVNGGDINANYADWWTAITDNQMEVEKPTYTVYLAKQDRMVSRTFAYSRKLDRIVEIDHFVIWEDESIPAGVLSALPNKSGADLVETIGELAAMLYAPAAQALLPYMQSEDEAVRLAAAKAISILANDDIADEVFGLLDHEDPRVSALMARALEVSLPKSLVKKVRKLAVDPATPAATRFHLVGALQFHDKPGQALDAMISVLRENPGTQDLRRRAAYGVGQVTTKDDVADVAAVIENEQDRYVLMTLAWKLNDVTRNRVSLSSDGALAASAPGDRDEFVEHWLAD